MNRFPTLMWSVLAVVSLLGGCSSRDDTEGPTPQLPGQGTFQVPDFVVGQVATRHGLEEVEPYNGIQDVEVGLAFRRAVRDLSMFEEEGPGQGPTIDWNLTYSLGFGPAEDVSDGSGDELPARAMVLMLLAHGESTQSGYEFEVQGLYRHILELGNDPQVVAEQLMQDGVTDLANAIGREAHPRVVSNEVLLTMLESTDNEVLLPVIREIYRRRLEEAGPRIRPLLDSADAELVLAAINLLGRIRDSQAVAPLIDLISNERHPELTELVLPALGQIGTGEARTYLQALAADPYTDDPVRQLARDTLDALEARPQ